MGHLVLDYEETYTERRTRRVLVEDDEGGDVTAWHGGRKLADLGGWTGVARAVADAREIAARFGVGPDSSLSIRVARTVTRRWSYPEDRDARPPGPRVIHRRHVHDVVRGEMPVTEAAIAFTLAGWVGVRAGEDPQPYVPFFAAPAIEDLPPSCLFAGYGHGEPEWTPARVRPAEVPEPLFERGDAGVVWHRVVMEGRLPVFVPPGGDAAELIRGGLRLDIDGSFDAIPREMRDRGRFRSCHVAADRSLRPIR